MQWSPKTTSPTPCLLRSVQALEDSIEILNTQFSTCELIKLDAAVLREGGIPDSERKLLLASDS